MDQGASHLGLGRSGRGCFAFGLTLQQRFFLRIELVEMVILATDIK